MNPSQCLSGKSTKSSSDALCDVYELVAKHALDFSPWDHICPIMLDGGNGYLPNAYSLQVPVATDLWYEWEPDPIDGYKSWFGVFDDYSGASIEFYYPVHAKHGSPISIIYKGSAVGFDYGVIHWTHGEKGLAEDHLADVIYTWAMALAVLDAIDAVEEHYPEINKRHLVTALGFEWGGDEA